MKKNVELITAIFLKLSIGISLIYSAYNYNYSAAMGWFVALVLSFIKTTYVFKFHVHDDRKIYTKKELIDFGYDCFANVYTDDNGNISYYKVPEEILNEK